jgi:hypothetical protein
LILSRSWSDYFLFFRCTCDLTNFDPVCGIQDNQMYYNPCVAGCLNKRSNENNITEYFDCQCMNSSYSSKVAKSGTCDVGCTLFPGFLVFSFVMIWFTFMSSMPNVVATLRSVEPIHRSLALGIESIILR